MKNISADFLLDIWADLKARKLAPVAIALVVVAVAMPALMLQGEEGASEGPLPILASNVKQGPEVEVAQELAERGSKLDTYKARDPFKGRIAPKDATSGGSGSAIAPGDLTGDDLDDGAPTGGGGGSGLSLPDLDTGGDSGSSDGSGGTGGSDGSPGQGTVPIPPVDVPPVKRYRYNYQLDVKFGRPGREQRYPNLTRLSFLPRPALPALLFMGVPVDEKSALFFVHPGLTHQGEGKCVPSRQQCNFLRLGVGKQHYLAADDHEFRIELLKIKRVKLSAERKQREQVRKASGRRSARSYADGAVPGTDETSGEELEFPALVDGLG